MIVVDVETTGLDPARHAVVSIGAVDVCDAKRTFYEECRIWDGAAVDDEALAVNGFTREKIAAGKDPNDVIRQFLSWADVCPTKILAGQNPALDLSMLQAACRRAGITWPLGHRTIDLHAVCFTHMLAHGLDPPTRNGRPDLRSDAIMGYVGLPAEPRPHFALNGAKWEAEAFSRLIWGKNLLPEFNKYPVPEHFR
ncbi:3'-5' exonuclease [Candidatus Woesearchaeota archaeon]|nr:3'-5' exonuclease [Candidatus Woesearchaeota archaeon]